MAADLKQLVSRLQEMDDQFSYMRSAFEDITRYVLPRRGIYLDGGSPDQIDPKKRYDDIIDDTATRANRTLGAGMQGGLCSPSRPWYRRTLADPDLTNFGPVKEWLHKVQQLEYAVLARSNFYNVIHTCFEEQGGFGTGPILQEADPVKVMRFKICTAGTYRIALSADGTVDTLYRDMHWTARQIVMRFGYANASTSVQSAFNSAPNKYFRIIHAIQPRTDRNPLKKDNRHMPFMSVWYEYGTTGKALYEGGFKEFPGAVPRWVTVGELPYGLSPGHDALGNTKMLQQMQKTSLKAIHKMVDPALKGNAKFKGILDLTPGAMNWSDGDTANVGPLFEVNLNIRDLEYKIEGTRSLIEKTFYTDLFLMLSQVNDGKDMTATEVMERHEEKLLMLGPTVERQIHELLEPILDRTFLMLDRAGLLPPPPPEIQGMEMKVEFISLLAQAQKLVTAQSIHAYLTTVERLAEIAPESLAKTDFDKVLEHTGEVVGVPPDIIRSDEETQERRDAEAEAVQQAQQAEQAAVAAKTMRDMGGASTETGTALGDLKKELS